MAAYQPYMHAYMKVLVHIMQRDCWELKACANESADNDFDTTPRETVPLTMLAVVYSSSG
jgi:hypothetical protein